MTQQRRTIAVVDDDAGVRAALADLLHSAGYRALTFASAEDFLEQGDTQRFDCLIADMHLPGMSGIALLRQLAANGIALPAVMITGREDPAMQEQIRHVGSVPFLRKPFADDELFAAMQQVLRT